MIGWTLIFFGVLTGLLCWASIRSYSRHRTREEFILAGSSLGTVLGLLTFSAALFSAFTFLGMPDFFRVHGVGAWIFLAFSDAVMVFFILWFAYRLRRRISAVGFRGVSGLLATCFGTRWAGVLFFICAFVFLVPYAAVQIRGLTIFFDAAFPHALPGWTWSVLVVALMLVYAEIGGLKAIVFSDAIQGLLLLVVIWIIGLSCLRLGGGLHATLATVNAQQPALLTLPGPQGLFTRQFLLVSTIAIVLIPVTQPQLTTRLVVVKKLSSVHRMAYAVGTFAILVILPTFFIGMYGAVKYPHATTAEFVSGALLGDQAPPVAALAIVGLFAACLSTTNAQLFALGSELQSLLPGEDRRVMRLTRLAILIFAVVVLIFSVRMSDQLALLARLSFTGTSVMAPLVLGAILLRTPPRALLYLSGAGLLIYLLSVLSLIPARYGGWSVESLLYIGLGVPSALLILWRDRRERRTANPK